MKRADDVFGVLQRFDPGNGAHGSFYSVQVDFFGTPEALTRNLEMEFQRNRERYQFLKWGMQAFQTFKVVPPGIGIVHQVNLEYLAKGVLEKEIETGGTLYYPDTLVG